MAGNTTRNRRTSRTTASAGSLDHPELNKPEQIPIDLLRPYPGNARTHDERQIAKIVASLESFGWMTPILAEKDGTIIAGHGRWMAAKKLGLKDCPVIRIEHLSDDAIRAYRIADNRLAELAGWDDDILKIELQHLVTADLGFNIENIGFDHAEIDIRIGVEADDGSGSGDPADEDVPGPEMTAISQAGDLWLLGKHRLYCGSALDAGSFEALMEGKLASMVFIDAPYNVPVQGHVSGLGKVRHREFVEGSGEMSDSEFRVFLARNARLLAEHSIDGAILMMCMDWRGLLPLQQAIGDAGLDLINLAIWTKTNGGMGALYRSQHELVLITKKGKAPHINNVQLGKHGRYRTNVWRYAGVNSFGKNRMEELAAHPTVKPIAMVADAIRDVSNRGQVVLDSFMGSGTTLLAAERTGRVAYGMDLDPLYVDLAIRRWEKLTGEAARLESSGASFAEVFEQRAVE